ncbi:MAG: hypothetical protein HRT38_16460 [Alteromonadaceae bacterium]|nr:hypothetical protein [Alteromonadaceae bacterium]
MIKDIYYQHETWGDLAIQYHGEIHHFSNLMSLVCYLQGKYGDDFNLIEVNDDNFHELYNTGAFNDQ